MNALSTQTSFRNAAAGIMAAMALTTMPFAAANDAQAQQPQVSSVAEALYQAGNKAENYSKTKQGVGIVIYYGASKDLPPAEAIGDKFVEAFKERNTEASYFIVNGEKPGVSMAFHVDRVAIGPFPPQVAAGKVSEVVSLRKGANNIATLSASY